MVALKRVNGALVRVSGGGSMGVLKRVNGGSMGVLKKINGGGIGGIEKGQWGRWSGSMGAWRRVRSDRGLALGQTGVWLWVRQGCGCGSDRRQEVVLQGCKLYLAGL